MEVKIGATFKHNGRKWKIIRYSHNKQMGDVGAITIDNGKFIKSNFSFDFFASLKECSK